MSLGLDAGEGNGDKLDGVLGLLVNCKNFGP
jgi:hypothetical protein